MPSLFFLLHFIIILIHRKIVICIMILLISILLILLVTWPLWVTYLAIIMIDNKKSSNILARLFKSYTILVIFSYIGSFLFSFILMAFDFIVGLDYILEKPIQWKYSSLWLYYFDEVSYALTFILILYNEIKIYVKKNNRHRNIKTY